MVAFADLALSRRLERAEALSNACAVEARARLAPDSDSAWIDVGGAYAMFDGAESPMTQTFGLGLFDTPTAAAFDAIERFFGDRGAPVFHEVSPLADPETFALLNARGYQPFEFTSVLFMPLATEVVQAFRPAVVRPAAATPAVDDAIQVRRVGAADADLYARTAAEGWREFGYADFMLDMARVYAATDGAHLFVAELDGSPIATAALVTHGGVAHLAGASTIPAGRRRGAQNALLAHRLAYAAAHGCDVALMGALPGSGSQRNAERNGFRIAYTRIKWRLAGR